jgi:hypothetical protein
MHVLNVATFRLTEARSTHVQWPFLRREPCEPEHLGPTSNRRSMFGNYAASKGCNLVKNLSGNCIGTIGRTAITRSRNSSKPFRVGGYAAGSGK